MYTYKLSTGDNYLFYMDVDKGLETLLELDGYFVVEEDGYWTKIKVSRVKVSKERPHGISYAMTLHDPSNKRILGFDNAHAVKPRGSRRKYIGRRVVFDHKHVDEKDLGTPYSFDSAEQLLIDFFDAVDKKLKEIRED